MRTKVLAASLVVSLGLWGCEVPTVETYTNSSGTLAISRDDALLYAVDADQNLLAIVDAQTEKKVAEVTVGTAPERVVVAPDDTVYVANRGSRSVSVVKRGVWSEAARIPVGVEPMGMAVSPDSKTLYVVNSAALDSAEVGSLMSFDTETLAMNWELKVGEEPRAIALTADNKALVSLYKRGEVVQVDLAKREVIAPYEGPANSRLYQAVNQTRLANDNDSFGRAFSSFHSRAAADVVLAPDGQRAYVPVVWAREDRITNPPSNFGGYYSSGGPCNIGAITTPGLLTLQADDAEPLVDDLTSCSSFANSDAKDFPPSTLATIQSGVPVQGPSAAVVDPTGAWLFVVNKESNNLSVFPTARRDGDFASTGTSVRTQPKVGAGPSGIALSRDGKRAFVHNAFDHNISVLESTGSSDVVARSTIAISSDDGLDRDFVAGRKLFFSAADSRMSAVNTGVACSSCHLEGREDGHVWNFPDGPRQTPSLAGRKTLTTAPYHWSGEFPTLTEFMTHTVRERMGGSQVTDTMANQIATYMEKIPAPENPYLRAEYTDAQRRGAHIFTTANCTSCHAGETFTNNKMANVGTFVAGGVNPDDTSKLATGLNTPSLLTLARTGPYLHDGSAGSLKQRLMQNKDSNLHGNTRDLTEAQMDDLVEYLKTL